MNTVINVGQQPGAVYDLESAARYLTDLGLSMLPQELEDLAASQGGPIFYQSGMHRLYPVAELDRWANAELGLASPFDDMPTAEIAFDQACVGAGQHQSQTDERGSSKQRVKEER